MNYKLKFLCFQGIHYSLLSFGAKLGYSRIKIDHIADSLLKLKIKIGEHLINAELSQLLTLTAIYARFAKKDNRLFATHYLTNFILPASCCWLHLWYICLLWDHTVPCNQKNHNHCDFDMWHFRSWFCLEQKIDVVTWLKVS